MQNFASELFTLRDWLRFAASRFNEAKLFFGHGQGNAVDEAAYLLAHTLHLAHGEIEGLLDARLTLNERQQFAEVLRRRVQERLPAAYLTHESWLGGLRFYVDERVIVPRSFLAPLIEEQISPWVDDPESVRVALDLCTGSGCLAILLAHAFPQADVDAVDLSPDALAVAQRNVADYDLQGRVNLLRSDLFANLEGKRYDLIISNPPYVNAAAMEELPAEYRHEPNMALAAGDDGLDAVRVILQEAPAHLAEAGLVVVEIGHNREAIEAAFPSLPFVWLDAPGGEGMVFLLHRADFAA
ncbi:MAG: 50S ribosomal protein L3 N(5)-glutamine methyltransferase [Betaproteobacteria bacterium]|nr:50S ribosomal protein L3 N(5)-glutamine methyltransferase [Betaproteobacteria bacterium]